jgi:hypothetical protein
MAHWAVCCAGPAGGVAGKKAIDWRRNPTRCWSDVSNYGLGCGSDGGENGGLSAVNGEFELTVRKRKAYAVMVEGWRIVSGTQVEAGELAAIVVVPII